MKSLPLSRQVAPVRFDLFLTILCFGALPATGAVLSSFGGGGSELLAENGQEAEINGVFVDYPAFTATTNPAYAGVITASALYSESGSTDASVTVSGELTSLKFASGSGAAYSSSADWSVSVTISFSGLGGGFLPSGSWLNLVDLDGNSINGPVGSRLFNMQAFDSTGTPINVPWLGNFVAGDFGVDASSPGQPSPSYPSDFPVFSEAGGVYGVQGAVTATATPVIAGQLLQSVRSIRFDYFGSSLDNTQIIFSDFAPPAVPEPASACMVGLAGMYFLRRRRKTLTQGH